MVVIIVAAVVVAYLFVKLKRCLDRAIQKINEYWDAVMNMEDEW